MARALAWLLVLCVLPLVYGGNSAGDTLEDNYNEELEKIPNGAQQLIEQCRAMKVVNKEIDEQFSSKPRSDDLIRWKGQGLGLSIYVRVKDVEIQSIKGQLSVRRIPGSRQLVIALYGEDPEEVSMQESQTKETDAGATIQATISDFQASGGFKGFSYSQPEIKLRIRVAIRAKMTYNIQQVQDKQEITWTMNEFKINYIDPDNMLKMDSRLSWGVILQGLRKYIITPGLRRALQEYLPTSVASLVENDHETVLDVKGGVSIVKQGLMSDVNFDASFKYKGKISQAQLLTEKERKTAPMLYRVVSWFGQNGKHDAKFVLRNAQLMTELNNLVVAVNPPQLEDETDPYKEPSKDIDHENDAFHLGGPLKSLMEEVDLEQYLSTVETPLPVEPASTSEESFENKLQYKWWTQFQERESDSEAIMAVKMAMREGPALSAEGYLSSLKMDAGEKRICASGEFGPLTTSFAPTSQGPASKILQLLRAKVDFLGSVTVAQNDIRARARTFRLELPLDAMDSAFDCALTGCKLDHDVLRKQQLKSLRDAVRHFSQRPVTEMPKLSFCGDVSLVDSELNVEVNHNCNQGMIQSTPSNGFRYQDSVNTDTLLHKVLQFTSSFNMQDMEGPLKKFTTDPATGSEGDGVAVNAKLDCGELALFSAPPAEEESSSNGGMMSGIMKYITGGSSGSKPLDIIETVEYSPVYIDIYREKKNCIVFQPESSSSTTKKTPKQKTFWLCAKTDEEAFEWAAALKTRPLDVPNQVQSTTV